MNNSLFNNNESKIGRKRKKRRRLKEERKEREEEKKIGKEVCATIISNNGNSRDQCRGTSVSTLVDYCNIPFPG